MIRILWFVHWPLNTFIGYSINSLSSLVNQTLKRTVEDPGFEKSLVKHKCPSNNKIPNGYFSIEVKVTRLLQSLTKVLVTWWSFGPAQYKLLPVRIYFWWTKLFWQTIHIIYEFTTVYREFFASGNFGENDVWKVC